FLAAVGQLRHGAAGEVLDHDVEAAFATRHVGELAPVGRDPRADVVAAFEADAADRAAARGDPVDLGRAAAVGGEVDRLAVGGEVGLGIDAARGHQALGFAAAVGRNQVDLREAVAGKRDRQ